MPSAAGTARWSCDVNLQNERAEAAVTHEEAAAAPNAAAGEAAAAEAQPDTAGAQQVVAHNAPINMLKGSEHAVIYVAAKCKHA